MLLPPFPRPLSTPFLRLFSSSSSSSNPEIEFLKHSLSLPTLRRRRLNFPNPNPNRTPQPIPPIGIIPPPQSRTLTHMATSMAKCFFRHSPTSLHSFPPSLLFFFFFFLLQPRNRIPQTLPLPPNPLTLSRRRLDFPNPNPNPTPQPIPPIGIIPPPQSCNPNPPPRPPNPPPPWIHLQNHPLLHLGPYPHFSHDFNGKMLLPPLPLPLKAAPPPHFY